MKTINNIAKILKQKKLTLATAESCTGGMIASKIVSISGASDFFKGGIVAYDNEIKHRVLKVPQTTLTRYGAVSGQTVRAMACGAARLFKCDCVVSVSGIAGPSGGTPSKPVGLVFIGVQAKSRLSIFKHVFKGGRASARRQASHNALKRLYELLLKF